MPELSDAQHADGRTGQQWSQHISAFKLQTRKLIRTINCILKNVMGNEMIIYGKLLNKSLQTSGLVLLPFKRLLCVP